LIEITWLGLTGSPSELTRELAEFPRTEVWPLEIGKPVQW
jgi:hypothetical protein